MIGAGGSLEETELGGRAGTWPEPVRAARLLGPLRRAAHRWFGRHAPPAAVDWVRLDSFAAHAGYQEAAAAENRRRRAIERALVAGEEAFTVPGHCWVCRRPVDFRVDYDYHPSRGPVEGVLIPNWREQLLCPGCNLRNRMRATLHFLEERLAPPPGGSIYAIEQTTDFFRCLRERYANVTGSEYLGQEVGFGEHTTGGIRNESVTRLSFADGSFDVVVSLDVFEHVPEYERALAECHRVLRPGGALLFSVPFRPDWQENLVRAAVDDHGVIRHLLPPEYHGDPLQARGCLAFYCFGWELLDRVRAAGFAEVDAYPFWSRDFGYLGADLILFFARKGSGQ